jgi:hypothetical protein
VTCCQAPRGFEAQRAGFAAFCRGNFQRWPSEWRRLLRELSLELSNGETERAEHALNRQARDGVALGANGVPTLTLGSWACGGIQDESAMRSILARYADKTRNRAGGSPASSGEG